ncbi:MAG: hypothetical protein ABI658_13940 [Acidimicrobiales bacterium]
MPTALLANRLVANSAVTAAANTAEQPSRTTDDRSASYAASPATITPERPPVVARCGLACDPDVGALWQQEIRASDTDVRGALVADIIRLTLRAIDDAVVAAAPALP